MGSYGVSIGSYWMNLPDYEHAYLRATSKTKEYFTKKKLEVTFGDGNSTEKFKIPFTKIFKLKKDKKTGRYEKDWESFDLRKVLWMELVRRGINVYLNPHVLAINNDDPRESIQYYLATPIFYNSILLVAKKPQPVLIKSYEAFNWFDKNCLRYK